jgi:hypothetical protein
MSERFHCWQNERRFQLQERNTRLSSLFREFEVYLAGEFQTSHSLNKGELTMLLESGGATILDAPPAKKRGQKPVVVACNRKAKAKISKDVPWVSTDWVIESIVHHEARDTIDYHLIS